MADKRVLAKLSCMQNNTTNTIEEDTETNQLPLATEENNQLLGNKRLSQNEFSDEIPEPQVNKIENGILEKEEKTKEVPENELNKVEVEKQVINETEKNEVEEKQVSPINTQLKNEIIPIQTSVTSTKKISIVQVKQEIEDYEKYLTKIENEIKIKFGVEFDYQKQIEVFPDDFQIKYIEDFFKQEKIQGLLLKANK